MNYEDLKFLNWKSITETSTLEQFSDQTDYLYARIAFNKPESWKDRQLFELLGQLVMVGATNKALDSFNLQMSK